MNTELSPIVPEPRCPISIRPATAEDMPFIDRLQKAHTHMAGFFPRQQMQKYLEAGEVLIAEVARDEEGRDEETKRRRDEVPEPEGSIHSVRSASATSSLRHSVSSSLAPRLPLGYIIARDSYSGRDDVGIIYQLIVEPLRQRHLVGASLVKAAFEKAAYGCRLFCCWCAQDIAANFFWESVGFAPVAFRTGTRSKQRTHIFWQCRTRAGDTTTPWWYPHQTRSGAFREDRLVFPIPANIHWRDPMPVIMPERHGSAEGHEGTEARRHEVTEKPAARQLPSGSGPSCLRASAEAQPSRAEAQPSRVPPCPPLSQARKVAIVRSQSKALQGVPPGKAAVITAGGIRYIDRADYETPSPSGRGWPEGPGEGAEAAPPKKPRKPRAPTPKHDPRHVALARELRDRWLEEVARNPSLILPAPVYDVSRHRLGGEAAITTPILAAPRLLPAA